MLRFGPLSETWQSHVLWHKLYWAASKTYNMRNSLEYSLQNLCNHIISNYNFVNLLYKIILQSTISKVK